MHLAIENELNPFSIIVYQYIMEVVRYQGKWFKIIKKPYEPESQTYQTAWAQIREPMIMPQEAYRQYFQTERENMKVLYPSFRKGNAD